MGYQGEAPQAVKDQKHCQPSQELISLAETAVDALAMYPGDAQIYTQDAFCISFSLFAVRIYTFYCGILTLHCSGTASMDSPILLHPSIYSIKSLTHPNLKILMT